MYSKAGGGKDRWPGRRLPSTRYCAIRGKALHGLGTMRGLVPTGKTGQTATAAPRLKGQQAGKHVAIYVHTWMRRAYEQGRDSVCLRRYDQSRDKACRLAILATPRDHGNGDAECMRRDSISIFGPKIFKDGWAEWVLCRADSILSLSKIRGSHPQSRSLAARRALLALGQQGSIDVDGQLERGSAKGCQG